MRITIEYQGYPTNEVPKKVIYERKDDEPWIDGDWDFLFESLKKYRDHLKMKAAREDSLGHQLDTQAKIDRLEELFRKYKDFIKIAEEGRYDI